MAEVSIASQPEPRPQRSMIRRAAGLIDAFTGKRLDEAKALSETSGLRLVTVDAAASETLAGMRRTGMRRVWDLSSWHVVDQCPAPGQPARSGVLVLAIAKPGEEILDGRSLEPLLRDRFNWLDSH